MDVLQKDRLGQDLRSQVTVGDLFRSVRSGQDALTPAAIVPMPLEAGHLHPGGDQVFLDVLRHFDGGTQRGVALGAVGQGLLYHSIDPHWCSSGQARVPRLLARGLRASGQRQKRKTGLLGRMKALNQTLDFLLQDSVLALEFANKGDEVLLGQFLQIGDDVQKNLPGCSGSGLTL